VSKPKINKLWLYRYRFYILQAVLAITFIGLVVTALLNSAQTVSQAEMESAVASSTLTSHSIISGDIVNLPYRALQTLSLHLFGLTPLAIKLPSLILALLSGVFVLFLINRWYRTNVAIIASILVIPSTLFLGAATTGTPAILLILYPALIFWLGAKVVGAKHPSPLSYFAFAIVLALACYTPYFIYFTIFIPLLCVLHPHLRMHLKRFSKLKLLLLILVFLLLLTPMFITPFVEFSALKQLFLPAQLTAASIGANFRELLGVFSHFTSAAGIGILTPVIGIALSLIALVGFATILPERHASRYRVTGLFTLFAIGATIIDPACITIFFIPVAILIASGVSFILTEWYSLFPENPYPRIFGGIFILAVAALIVIGNTSFYLYATNHNPATASKHFYELSALQPYLDQRATIVVPEDQAPFYQLLTRLHPITITTSAPATESPQTTIFFDPPATTPPRLALDRIVTGTTYDRADLLYVYQPAPEDVKIEE
jgi:4-amino-4-deoxy-L-arabinose transferase-like glycosyltransferase